MTYDPYLHKAQLLARRIREDRERQEAWHRANQEAHERWQREDKKARR
jgi:hypothetical protein